MPIWERSIETFTVKGSAERGRRRRMGRSVGRGLVTRLSASFATGSGDGAVREAVGKG